MSRLGKGLDALFIDNLKFNEEKQSNEEIVDIEIKDLRRNPYQPRKVFDDDKIEELAQSISQHGVFQPIIVKKNEAGPGYYIIAGERRFRACQKIGLTKIPAIIREIDDKTMAEIALLENLQRENLTIVEEAGAYKMLMEKYGLTQQEVADRIGKSRPHVTNALRIAKLPQVVLDLINDGKLEFGHAKVLVGLDLEEQNNIIIEIANRVIKENLTVRNLESIVKLPAEVFNLWLDNKLDFGHVKALAELDTEKQKDLIMNLVSRIIKEKLTVPQLEVLVKDAKENKVQIIPQKTTKELKEVKNVHYEFLEDQIREKLGTKVTINIKDDKNGKLIIDFTDIANLNDILEKLNLLDTPLQ